MYVFVSRTIELFLAVLLVTAVFSERFVSQSSPGIPRSKVDNFKLVSYTKPSDILGIAKRPSYLEVYIASHTFERRYSDALKKLGRSGNFDKNDLAPVREALHKIWPEYQNDKITKTKLARRIEHLNFDPLFYTALSQLLFEGNALYVLYISIADIFEDKKVTFTYDRTVKCQHHGSPDQARCKVCRGTGLHLVKNLDIEITLPRGVANNEVFTAPGQGDYVPKGEKYGDLNIIVRTVNTGGFRRGPFSEESGSPPDLYLWRKLKSSEINEETKTVEIKGLFNKEKVVFKLSDSYEDIGQDEIYNPRFKDVYDDLKSKYGLKDSDFHTIEKTLFQCLPNLGLPFRRTPALRGKLCIPRESAFDGVYLHKSPSRLGSAQDDLWPHSAGPKQPSKDATDGIHHESEAPKEPVVVKHDKGSPYGHYADDDL